MPCVQGHMGEQAKTEAIGSGEDCDKQEHTGPLRKASSPGSTLAGCPYADRLSTGSGMGFCFIPSFLSFNTQYRTTSKSYQHWTSCLGISTRYYPKKKVLS